MTPETRPLAERVEAPAELPEPRHPDVAVWRPATVADVDAIWNLERAIGAADHPNYVPTREQIADDFGFSHFHPDSDTRLGIDASGTLIAYGLSLFPPGQETLVRTFLSGGVHPAARGRGIGRQLIRWQLARAKQQLASSPKTLPGWIVAFTDERAPVNAALFERAGLTLARYFIALERNLAEPVRAIDLPPGVRIEPYRPEFAAAVRAARNEVFMDHWASQPVSDEIWASFVGAATFRADLSFLAITRGPDGRDHVAGFLMTTVNEEDWERQGFRGSYVDLVGVRASWRGKHVAQALLAAHIDKARSIGFERTSLDVDADSPTGALGLYTGMGYRPAHRELAYTLVL